MSGYRTTRAEKLERLLLAMQFGVSLRLAMRASPAAPSTKSAHRAAPELAQILFRLRDLPPAVKRPKVDLTESDWRHRERATAQERTMQHHQQLKRIMGEEREAEKQRMYDEITATLNGLPTLSDDPV